VVETEALESLALGGGLMAAAGAFELVTGAVVLALGIAAGGQLALLAVFCAVAALLAARVQRALARWSGERIALTHDLVERMVGQRTLVAQQAPARRHVEQEAGLARYAGSGRALDRAGVLLAIVVPRGWLIAAVALLAPRLADAGTRPGAFATSLGGTLLVYGALRKLAQAFPALGGAAIAWRQVAAMFAGADRAPVRPAEASAPSGAAAAAPHDAALISARDLGFGYPGRAEPVLTGCALDVRRGERLLIEGPSGGGKSTLAALLVGLRVPDTGRLALAGVDQKALGLARWRGRVGAAPQFHENHVFSASFSFNLLLGRAWPPRREDVVEAEAIIRELDLGPLLARMPSGLEQLVGDSGWQLSHGERSRLFIARSLLQRLDVRVLDESFAALDPETLERVLACVLRRAETLVVIAHP
jgi:ATP-binding cassette subfamily B protein